MNQHLQEILQETNTIIIPGLGALTITSAKTGDIYFMPFLKHDDGRLAKFISEKEKIDVNEAKKTIVEYVTIVSKALEDEKYFEMAHFGKFFVNKNSEIEFQKWEDYQQIDKSILAAAKRRKEEEIKKNDEKVHHYIDEHKIESPNPLHLSLDEIQIHPVYEENIEKLSDSDSELDNDTITENIIKDIESKEQEIIEDIETLNQSINNENKPETIETNADNIYSNQTTQTFNITETENINNTQSEKSLDEILSTSETNIINSYTIDSEEKKTIKKESINENITNKKKKKGGIIVWILVGLVITSGIIAYTLHQRKGEKIVIKEQIVISKAENKQKIEKHVTTEIIKEEKIKNSKPTPINNAAGNKEKSKNNKLDNKKKVKDNTQPIKIEGNKAINTNSNKISKIDKKNLTEKTDNIDIQNRNKIEVTSIGNKEKPNTINNSPKKENIIQIDANKTKAESNSTNINQPVIKPNTNSTTNTINKPATQATNITNISSNNTIQQTPKIANTTSATTINKSKNSTNSAVQTTPLKSNSTLVTSSDKITATPQKNSAQVKQNINTDKEITNKKNNTSENNKTPLPQKGNTTSVENNPSGKKIQLIAGTFKDKASAEKLMSQLKTDGYTNTKITEKQGIFEVNIDSYATLSETYKALQKYKNGSK